MTHDEFVKLRYVDELARVFSTQGKIRRLLREANIPREVLPQVDRPIEFWSDVCDDLFQGLVPDGMPRLMAAASHQFPGNATFKQVLRAFSEPPPPVSGSGEPMVFLAYATPNRAAVEVVARELESRGIKPWFDDWNLPPGQQVMSIGKALDTIPAFAAFVGPAGAEGRTVGPWQTLEIGAVLARAANSGMPLIPVYLPGAPPVEEGPPLLRPFRAIRFASLSDAKALDELVWGITQRHPRSGP